jgi:hypothetical protein
VVGQGLVLFGGGRGQAVAGLGCDDHACPAARDHLAELFEHERRAIEIDLEDRLQRSLDWADEPGDVAQAGGLLAGPFRAVMERSFEISRADSALPSFDLR